MRTVRTYFVTRSISDMRVVRKPFRLIILCGMLLIASAVEVSVGPLHIPLTQIIPQTAAFFHGSHAAAAVVMGAIRWPRLLIACLVGAALASTGTALQAIFRNPMADPSIIGVSSGGSLGAVFMMSLGLAAGGPWLVPIAAFISGLAAMLIVYRFGTIGGRTAVHSLLLSGVAVSAFCSAMVTLMLSLAPTQTMQEMLFWLMGGLDGSTWTRVLVILVFSVVGFLVYWGMSLALDVMSIGEEQASGVGVNMQRAKQVVLLTAAFVVGACVSVSGVIGFVGLIVPHLMRIWIGPSHRWLLPAAAVGGALLVVLSDIVARVVLAPVELNIGIVTSCLGAPFFLYLLRRQYANPEQR